MRKNISIFCLIIATIIGAGFSSGSEISIFFNSTGKYSMLNIFLSSIYFFVIIYGVLNICVKNRIGNYMEFIVELTNDRVGNIVDKVIKIFLLICFFVMISGFGSLISQIFGIEKIFGSIILVIATYITLQFNIDGIMKVSNFIVSIILLGIFMIMFLVLKDSNVYIENNIYYENNLKDIFSGIIYASYNLVIAIPMIVNVAYKIKNRKDITIISIFISLLISILIIVEYFILNKYASLIYNIDMPILYISKILNKNLYYYYIIVISFSIYTTAISTLYSVICIKQGSKKEYNFYLIIICLISLIASNLGFANLIKYGFGIIGIIGILQGGLIIKKHIDNK